MKLPITCPNHPHGLIDHEYDLTQAVLNGEPSGSGITSNRRYFCHDCRLELSNMEMGSGTGTVEALIQRLRKQAEDLRIQQNLVPYAENTEQVIDLINKLKAVLLKIQTHSGLDENNCAMKPYDVLCQCQQWAEEALKEVSP